MNICLIWSIIGLLNCAIAYEKHENKHNVHGYHAARYHNRDHSTVVDDELPQTSGSPLPVSVAPPLANYDSLNLIFNLEKKTLAFANVSANVGFAYVACDDGVVKLLVDAKSGTTLRYVHASNITRIQTDETKGEILKSIAIILKLETENGTIPEGSQIDQTSEEALRILSDVYLHVARKNDLRSRSLKNFGIFVDKLEHLYLGPLTGILQGPNPVPLKQNLNRFLSISIGLKELFTKAVGGLKGILAKGVCFEVNPLYNAKNGAEVFVYILRQTGAKFNLATLWGRLLNDIEKVLHIIQLLGGGESTNGVDETFGFLGHIWSALNLRVSIPNLITYLLKSSSEENWSKVDDGDFSKVLKDLKNITDEQSKKYDNSGLITPFVSFFSNLTANNLIQNGVNVSDLVEKWRKRDVIGGFKSVTQVLLGFVNPEKYSNYLFNSFTAFLNSTSDTSALNRLFPGISVDQFTKQGSSLWESISKSFNVDNLLKNNGNSTEVLNGVPGFGEFSKIYKDTFGSPFNFTKTLNGQTITDYLSKGFGSPFNWTSGIFQESGNFIKHIFWDPFKPIFSGFNQFPGIITLPTVPPAVESISSHTKIVTDKEIEDDNPKTTPSNSETSDNSITKTSTESKEVKLPSTVSTPEIDENSEKNTEKTSTERKEVKLSTEVEVEVSTESKASTEFEFKHHHHNKHHQNKHHHEKNHENKNAHHGSGRHHESKKDEHHDDKRHLLRHNSGEIHQSRRNEKLEGRHAHHRQEKEHQIHHQSNK